MLKKKKYRFLKREVSDQNKFIVYGDNLEEANHIIQWFYEFNKEKMEFVSISYKSLSEYIYEFSIQGVSYYFVAMAYYRNGNLPYAVRKLIKELDKPDAIVYSVSKEKVIMGFETTETTLAGNATWQRTGRIVNFLESHVPFAFLAYYSKHDKSDLNPKKKPRVPSALFTIMFLSMSLKYSTPALVGFFEHPDKNQNLDALHPKEDFREAIFEYLYSLVLEIDGEKYLKKCYLNMKNYYFSENHIEKTRKEFGEDSLTYLKDPNFHENIIRDMKEKRNVPLFPQEKLIFTWKHKVIHKEIQEMFPSISFYQLSKNCKAGITFETEKLVEVLSNYTSNYIEDYIDNNIFEPTIVIPIKLTKMDNKIKQLVPTDDPYNGEIPAFSNLYLQSFPKANIMLILYDHTSNNEYEVESAKGRKIYKAISKYANLVVDMDLNLFSRESENVKIESKKKYTEVFTTEDDVTSFFGTILLSEGITPSFINPPCGSWSDIHLYPTDKYYYYNRDDERGDIAYFNKEEKVYYVGESKKNFSSLSRSLEHEYEKTLELAGIIRRELQDAYPTKLFALFKGTKEEASRILKRSDFDFVVILDDKEEITLEVVGRDEIYWE